MKSIRLFIIFSIIAVTFYFLWCMLLLPPVNPPEKTTTISPVSSVLSATNAPTSTPTPIKKTASLGDVVQNELVNTKGTYGVAIKNLANGEYYYANEHGSFEAGSLYKLWVMATVYQKIKLGVFDEKTIMSQKVSVLADEFQIPHEEDEKPEDTVTYSVDDALYQMITISDNYAALLLTEKIGLSKVALFLQENGFYESSVGTDGRAPTVTPYDAALFFEKLFAVQLADDEYTTKMLDLLRQQKLNTKIPKYIPQTIIVAHKTGEINGYSHDAGIVYAPNGDFVIAVLTESGDPELAEERIANVSQAVYHYFTQ